MLDIGVSDGLGLKSLFQGANLVVGIDIDDEKLAQSRSQ